MVGLQGVRALNTQPFSKQINVNRGLSKSNHGNHFLPIPEIWSINESKRTVQSVQ